MAELRWDNGKLLVNEFGLGDSSGTASGTLESIVNLATQPPPPPPPQPRPPEHDDINVPLMKRFATCDVNGSAGARKGKQMSGSDTCEKELGASTASFCSLATTRETISLDGSRDSEACLAPSQGHTCGDEEKKKGTATSSSLLTKRSRAAANHNQSERKRRRLLNEKMEILQKMVPNSNKTDKSSMLDGVINYLKILQTQVQILIMNKTGSSPSGTMSHPMPQHHPQMPMMGVAANMNMAHQNLGSITRPPLVNPSASFVPMVGVMPPSLAHGSSDDLSSFPVHSQLKSMSVEEFTRVLALMQLHQQQELEASRR